jgi:hypothetical protein
VAADCDNAAAQGADKFFLSAVPSYNPVQTVAVKEMGALLKAAMARQSQLVAALQAAVPKLDKCKIANLASFANKSNAGAALVSVAERTGFETAGAAGDEAVGKIAEVFAARPEEISRLVATSRDVLAAVAAKTR